MALASRGGSGLNPNAPAFIPDAYQQVEDFSTEWWNLVQSSTWFRDYWLRERHEEEDNNNVTNNNLPGINNNNEQFQDFHEDIDGFTELELQLEEAVLLGIDASQLEEDQALEWQQQQQLFSPKDFAHPGGTPVELVEREAPNLKSCAEAARSPLPLFEETKITSD